MADDPIPAVSEAAATGAIAAIFADIRSVYRVGAVNLIWRHLATIPGALPWAWRAIRPVYVDGTVGREAARFRTSLRVPTLPLVPPEVFAAIGLSVDAMARIHAVLTAYDRTNSMALIALTALSFPSSGPSSGDASAGVTAEPEDALSLPPLTPLHAMPLSVADLVMRLNRFGSNQPEPILASMYRHLSHWPPYLGLAWMGLAPMEADGSLRATTLAVADQARAIGAGVPVIHDGAPEGALAAIAPFIGDVLPKMVAICGMLRRMSG